MFHHISRAALAFGCLTALAVAPAAQGTTGIPGVNQFTLNGMTPGASSCPLLFPFPSGPAVFNVNTAPSAPVVFLINLNCPCRPCLLPWAPAPAACGLPPLTCAPSNQAFELNAGFGSCVLLSVPSTANVIGDATVTIPFPPLIRFSTQAVLLHPCSGGNIVFTQAYQVSTV